MPSRQGGPGSARRPTPRQSAPPLPQTEQARQDAQQLAMIQQQQSALAARVAQMNEDMRYVVATSRYPSAADARAAAPLAAAELARLEKAIDAAYEIFQEVRTNYADTPTAEQARGEILV